MSEITRVRALYSAANLMKQAGEQSYLRRKRSEAVSIAIGKAIVNIRDQQPLHTGNMKLESGWLFEDVIRSLNERVFFWPGMEVGPISYGERHYERYAKDRPIIIRIKTADLFSANSHDSPMYCRFNSGSPRCSKGIGSPRGPNTFMLSGHADFTPSKVVEVTFNNEVKLPNRIEVGDSVFGPWRSV